MATHQPEMTVRTAYDLKPSMMTSITLILSLLALGHCVCQSRQGRCGMLLATVLFTITLFTTDARREAAADWTPPEPSHVRQAFKWKEKRTNITFSLLAAVSNRPSFTLRPPSSVPRADPRPPARGPRLFGRCHGYRLCERVSIYLFHSSQSACDTCRGLEVAGCVIGS